MKIKKPEEIRMLVCSSGPPVETLDLWKRAEIMALLHESPDSSSPESRESLTTHIINEAERFIAILWLKEKGRPNGAKDKKPRVKRTAEAAAAKAA